MAEPAPVVKTTSVREVIPANQARQRTTPEFWEYVEALKPAEWDRHLLYIYRVEDGRNLIMEKCGSYLSLPGGQQVSVNDQEALELAISQKFGGGTFRLILKRGSERVTETRVYTEGPRKVIIPPPDNGSNGGQTSTMSDASATAQVAGRAMDAMTNLERQSAEIGFRAMGTAAEVMQRFAQPQPANSSNSLMDRMMTLALERFLNPPDPVAQFAAMLGALRQFSPSASDASGAPRDPLVTKILETGLERVLNPTSTAAPVSASAELVRSLPAVVTHATEGIHEWRLGMEAQRDALALQARVQPPPGARPLTMLPPPTPQPQATQPQPNPTAEAQAMGTTEFIEQKIVEIFNEYPSADEAADEALSFLARMSPEAVKQLTDLGENGLAGLFLTRPILKQCTNDRPRLKEFIQAFLKYAAGDKTKPVTPLPPPGVA